MTSEERRRADTKVLAALLVLLALGLGAGMHAAYADEDHGDEGGDGGDGSCTSVLGVPVICSSSDAGGAAAQAR